MDDLLADLIDAAAGRADHADARFVRSRSESIRVRNGLVREVSHEEEGFGVRVRVRGAWGFAAAAGCDRAAAEAALARALEVAERQPAAPVDPGLAAEPAARGEHASAFELDPFEVPRERKLELLLAAADALGDDPRLAVREASSNAFREERWLAASSGARCRQTLTECGGGVQATAVDGGDAQVRSYPGAHGGNVAQAGFEHLERLALAAEAPRVGEQAVALLWAPRCPPGRATVLLDGEQLALQLHESVGHATELDRVLGGEASYAGTSFLSAGDAGSLRYGSELMNVTADATAPGGLGSFAWDDEGVAAQAVPLVRDGVLRGFLSSRESAAQVGLPRSGGCARAAGFARQPIVRMTNVDLAPGAAGTLDDLVAATDRGLLLETNRSWSIDDRRLQFQFATELAWEIRGGERVRMLRDPVYAGVTPRFWAGLDAICSAPAWRRHSVLTCGKGEPGQFVHVSHGVAPARFRDVEVGGG